MRKLNEINPKELDVINPDGFLSNAVLVKYYKDGIEAMREEIRKEMIKELKKCITEINEIEPNNASLMILNYLNGKRELIMAFLDIREGELK